MAGPPSAVVVNPSKVDDAKDLRSRVRSTLADAGWPEPSWWETTPDDPGAGQAAKAVRDGAEVVFACGGDGTVQSCLSALAGSRAALAIVPVGTGNLLATNLGIPTDTVRAVRVATQGGRRRIDVGRTDDMCFAVAAGIGFDAEVLDAPEPLKRALGWPAYVVSAVRHLHDPHFVVEIRLDDAPPSRQRARSVMVANVADLRGRLTVAPDASDDDGALDVVVVAPRRPRDWVSVVYRTLRRRPHPQVQRYKAGEVDIRVLDRAASRQVDGNTLEPGDRLHVVLDRRALEVCVP
ncbi:MAG: diacylglycerol kinase [Streptosporangiales bacterium]|nr:diacylglycerol kinase [Streptosporangiales bacterium]